MTPSLTESCLGTQSNGEITQSLLKGLQRNGLKTDWKESSLVMKVEKLMPEG